MSIIEETQLWKQLPKVCEWMTSAFARCQPNIVFMFVHVNVNYTQLLNCKHSSKFNAHPITALVFGETGTQWTTLKGKDCAGIGPHKLMAPAHTQTHAGELRVRCVTLTTTLPGPCNTFSIWFRLCWMEMLWIWSVNLTQLASTFEFVFLIHVVLYISLFLLSSSNIMLSELETEYTSFFDIYLWNCWILEITRSVYEQWNWRR